MTEVDRLRVVYELQDQQYRAGMERMRRATTTTSDQIIAQAKRAERGLAGIGKAFAGAFSAAVIVGVAQRLTKIADTATQMQNSLRIAGLEGAELSRVYDQLFASAQRNSAPISSLVDLYSKLSLTQKELGVSGEELIHFTDGIAVALKVAGTDATAASGSLLQLSQALGGGIVRAEEFNSILEGTPIIAQTVARGLKEANGSVAELRKLVVDGKVSSTAFFRAFEAGSADLRDQAESSQSTVGQAFTRLGNSLVDVVGDFDRATGASSSFADGITSLSNGLDKFDAEGFISKIQSIIDKFVEAEEAGTNWLNSIGNSDIFARLNEVTGLTEGGQIVNPDVREAEAKIVSLEKEVGSLQAQIENNTSLGFDNTEAIARLGEVRAELAALRAEASGLSRYVDGIRRDGSVVRNMTDSGTFYDGSNYSPPPAPPASSAPVSLGDFPAVPSKPGGGSGRKRSGGGRKSGGQKKTAADVLVLGENDIRDLERQISLLGKSNQEVATAEARWAMLDAAKKAGIPVNDQLNSQIDAQAEKVGTLTQQLEQAQLQQEQFDQAIEGVADAFAGALVAGESLRDGLAQVFKQIASDILSSGIRDALMGQFGGGGGLLGSIFGGLFGGGQLVTGSDALSNTLRGISGFRANGGGVQAGSVYGVGEKGPELFVPSVNGAILNVAQAQAALRGQSAGGQSVIMVELSAELVASVLAEAEGQSIRISQETAAAQAKALPSQIQKANRKPRWRP